MKKFYLSLLVLAFGLLAHAQNVSVKTFKLLPMDLTASSLEGKRIDQNGEVAALIKVVTTQTGFTFEGGVLGIVDSRQRNGEIWVWVPRASRKITLLHQQLGVLRDYRFPVEIEAERTYEMVLDVMPVPSLGFTEEPKQQHLIFHIEPAEAVLVVDDQIWEVGSNGTAMKPVDFGTYTYYIQAKDYQPKMGKVTVKDPDNPKIVTVTLSRIMKDKETFTVNGVSFKMKLIESGTFQMGSDESDADEDEESVHNVTVSSFYMGETEVTQALWKAVMGTTVSQQRDKGDKSWPLCGIGGDYPMYYVSWDECQEFIRKLNRKTGKNFRLPTEAEWEYAARGGNKSNGYKYAGSNNMDEVVWSTCNSGGKTHEVKKKMPNELGLYDMSGNVWEWCNDWYDFEYYDDSSSMNPQGPFSGKERVIRGSSWNNNAKNCRVTNRKSNAPDNRSNNCGFRLVLSR